MAPEREAGVLGSGPILRYSREAGEGEGLREEEEGEGRKKGRYMHTHMLKSTKCFACFVCLVTHLEGGREK